MNYQHPVLSVLLRCTTSGFPVSLQGSRNHETLNLEIAFLALSGKACRYFDCTANPASTICGEGHIIS